MYRSSSRSIGEIKTSFPEPQVPPLTPSWVGAASHTSLGQSILRQKQNVDAETQKTQRFIRCRIGEVLLKEELETDLAKGDPNNNPSKQYKIEAGSTPKPKTTSPQLKNPNENSLANASDTNTSKLHNKESKIFIKNN